MEYLYHDAIAKAHFSAKGHDLMFRRKVYDQLLEWKRQYSDRYAVLLEGARRVGKSTIVEAFAKAEYKSYIFLILPM